MTMKMDTDTSVIDTAITIGELDEGDGLGVTDTVGKTNKIINFQSQNSHPFYIFKNLITITRPLIGI